MFKRQLLIGVFALSIAAFGLSSMTYAHEGADDNRGHHEIQVNDDRGNDRLVELQIGDDRGVDAAQLQTAADNGVDPQPHA